LTIIELAERLGFRLWPAGKGKKMLCIFHQETRPSLYLDGEKNCFYCHSCGERGGFVKFYAVAKGISPEQARAELRSQNISIKHNEAGGIYRPREKKPKKAEYSHIYEAFIKHLQGYEPEQRAVDYLHQERLLTEETIKYFNLCVLSGADTPEYKQVREFLLEAFTPEELKQAGILDKTGRVVFSRHRVIIPVIEEGKFIGLQGRYFDKACNTEPPVIEGKYKNTAGGVFTGVLFNGDILRDAQPGDKVVICEGAFDTMLCYQEKKRKDRETGERHFVTGFLSATAWTEENIKSLAGYDLILAFDNDLKHRTGQKAMEEILTIYYRLTGKPGKVLDLRGCDLTEDRRRHRQ